MELLMELMELEELCREQKGNICNKIQAKASSYLVAKAAPEGGSPNPILCKQ